MATHRQSRPASEGERAQAPLWERSAAFIGLILLLGSLAYLVYEGIWGDQSPPDVVVAPVDISDNGRDFLVEFEAHNDGGQTAAAVIVTGVLSRDGHQVETREATIGYLPSGSSRRGGLYFSHDPRNGELELRASGYQRP